MPDALIRLMEAKSARLAEEIAKHIPEFVIDYEIYPVCQAIADTWPRSIEDSAARAKWD
jgi:hypothetical protein